jgi:tight adherence protein B
MAASLRSLADAQREMQTALASPVATAKLVMALPLVGVLFAIVLGFDPLGTLFTNPLGLACLGGGVALLFAGHRWNRALIARAQPTDVSPGLWCELTAIAVSGGGALERALTSVDVAAEECGIPSSPTEAAVVARTVELSSRAGVPAGELLRAEAEEQRRQARADAATRAARLSVQLMIPLGACVLPAFMLLGVAPLLISVIASTVAGF